MKHTLKIIAMIIIFASCKANDYNNSNSKTDSSKIKRIDTSTIPSNIDSTAGQSGKMSNTFRDSAQPKIKK